MAEALTIVGDRIGVVGTTASVRGLANASTRVSTRRAASSYPASTMRTCTLVRGRQASASRDRRSSRKTLHWTKSCEARERRRGEGASGRVDLTGEIGSRVLDDPRATRATVDAVSPDHPVMLTAWTGHGTLLNTAALRQLQVRDDEPDPPGGFFLRVPGSRLVNGVAHEYAEYILRQRLSMMPDEQAQEKGLRDAAAEAVGFGITSVQLMATNRPAAQLARTAVAADLPVRVRVIDFR